MKKIILLEVKYLEVLMAYLLILAGENRENRSRSVFYQSWETLPIKCEEL